jgi:hypothetical protein
MLVKIICSGGFAGLNKTIFDSDISADEKLKDMLNRAIQEPENACSIIDAVNFTVLIDGKVIRSYKSTSFAGNDLPEPIRKLLEYVCVTTKL